MKRRFPIVPAAAVLPSLAVLWAVLWAAFGAASLDAMAQQPVIENPAIDMNGYLRVSAEAARHRASRRLREEDFLRLANEPGTIVLDARSRDMYELLHVKGAVNLSFPDITIASLKRLIPDPATRVLIYCNNNFSKAEGPFPSKLPAASLNLSTYIALFTYGYRNVYELGPLVDIRSSKRPFEPQPISK